MAEHIINRQQLTIRVGHGTLSFSTYREQDRETVFEPYVVKSGVSMAANLREAFKTSGLLQAAPMAGGMSPWPAQRVRLSIFSDLMMVPIEQFDEKDMAAMHNHVFPRSSHDAICYDVLPDLNAVAVFSINRDLRLVVDDHYPDARIVPAMNPVWRHLHQRSFTGKREKLYAYFNERHLEVFAFRKNRFRFCNSFETSRAADAIYFLLYVWKQLQMQPEHDELHIVGNIPQEEWTTAELRKYLQNVYVVNPTVDFNNHPVTEVSDMPYDLMTLYARGR